MWPGYFIIQITIIYMKYLLPVECRTYDVETESMQIFGENLSQLLKRFRKSPEYLKILNTRLQEWKQNTEDMISTIGFAYQFDVLRDRVNKSLSTDYSTKNRAMMLYSRRQGSCSEEDQNSTNPDQDQNKNKDKDKDKDQKTTTLSPVELLDMHAASQGSFPVNEKNTFRDIGFAVAGEAIHKMIDSMGVEEDKSDKSTRFSLLPTTTTTHVNHEVTVGVTDETESVFRMRAQKLTTESTAAANATAQSIAITTITSLPTISTSEINSKV